MLKDPDIPTQLLGHRLILLSVEKTWRYGRITDMSNSVWDRAVRRLDVAATPQ